MKKYSKNNNICYSMQDRSNTTNMSISISFALIFENCYDI